MILVFRVKMLTRNVYVASRNSWSITHGIALMDCASIDCVPWYVCVCVPHRRDAASKCADRHWRTSTYIAMHWDTSRYNWSGIFENSVSTVDGKSLNCDTSWYIVLAFWHISSNEWAWGCPLHMHLPSCFLWSSRWPSPHIPRRKPWLCAGDIGYHSLAYVSDYHVGIAVWLHLLSCSLYSSHCSSQDVPQKQSLPYSFPLYKYYNSLVLATMLRRTLLHGYKDRNHIGCLHSAVRWNSCQMKLSDAVDCLHTTRIDDVTTFGHKLCIQHLPSQDVLLLTYMESRYVAIPCLFILDFSNTTMH